MTFKKELKDVPNIRFIRVHSVEKYGGNKCNGKKPINKLIRKDTDGFEDHAIIFECGKIMSSEKYYEFNGYMERHEIAELTTLADVNHVVSVLKKRGFSEY